MQCDICNKSLNKSITTVTQCKCRYCSNCSLDLPKNCPNCGIIIKKQITFYYDLDNPPNWRLTLDYLTR